MGWRITLHHLRSDRGIPRPALEHRSDCSWLCLVDTAEVKHVGVSMNMIFGPRCLTRSRWLNSLRKT